MKKTLIIGIIIVLGITYWPLSLLWKVKAFDKEFPGLREALGTMTPKQQQELIEQMEATKNIIIEKLENPEML